MNENDIRSESQKYLDEMMRFYSMNKNASVNTNESQEEPQPESVQLTQPPPESITLEKEEVSEDIADEELNAQPEVPEETLPENIVPPEPPSDEMDFESFERKFPPPVIPEFIREQPSVPDYGKMPSAQIPESPSVPYSDYGFLKIETRTADNGLPVPGAAVTVAKKNGKEEELIFTGVTYESGSIPKIKLPAPPNLKGNSPESFDNYAVYNVTAFSKGFYREVSADVPVFAGVTSIQRFNLIPMPFNFDDNGQSINIENTEPNF